MVEPRILPAKRLVGIFIQTIEWPPPVLSELSIIMLIDILFM